MTLGKLPNEVHRLLKRIDRVSNGQAKVSSWDPDNVERVTLEISPKEGLYEGGKFKFEVIMGEDFPVTPPIVRCLTPVYHPNIDPTDESEDDTNVCLNMFDLESWEESYGLDGALQGILFLFYHPNTEDPLSPFFDPSLTDDEFEDNVKRSLNGENVEGFQYTRNLGGEAEVLIMNMVESNDKTVDIKKGDDGGGEAEAVITDMAESNDKCVDIKRGYDGNCGENALTYESNKHMNATNVDETVIPDICNVNDHPPFLDDVCNVKENNVATNSETSLSDNIEKQSTVQSSPSIHHCARHCSPVHLQTFNSLSPETDVLLFVISRIVSNFFTSIFLTRS